MDPFSPNEDVRQLCRDENVAFEAYSTGGTQWWHSLQRNPVADSPVLQSIALVFSGHPSADGHSTGARTENGDSDVIVTPAQVSLAWALAKGALVCPKSNSEQHIRENAVVVSSLTLSKEHIDAIDALAGSLNEHE